MPLMFCPRLLLWCDVWVLRQWVIRQTLAPFLLHFFQHQLRVETEVGLFISFFPLIFEGKTFLVLRRVGLLDSICFCFSYRKPKCYFGDVFWKARSYVDVTTKRHQLRTDKAVVRRAKFHVYCHNDASETWLQRFLATTQHECRTNRRTWDEKVTTVVAQEHTRRCIATWFHRRCEKRD